MTGHIFRADHQRRSSHATPRAHSLRVAVALGVLVAFAIPDARGQQAASRDVVGTSGDPTARPGAGSAPPGVAPSNALPLEVHITSPLGRTGTPTTVRIVAQVRAAIEAPPRAVKFYVDGLALGAVTGAPPYAMEWMDDNPFERHEISVEAEDGAGRTARDAIVLKPFEVAEETGITSVLVEAGVYDRRGRYIKGLDRTAFDVREDGVPQRLDLQSEETLPTTFALLVDSSNSMVQRMDFVQKAADRLVEYLRPRDRVMVAPFSKSLGAITGPTADRRTVLEAISSIHGGGGTSIFDALIQAAGKLSTADGRRAIVLLTDGFDENSTRSADDALTALRAARVTPYVVGIGGVAGVSLEGHEVLRRIVEQTGGRVFFPRTEQELPDVYDALATDAQNRYLLSYSPTNQKADGRFRRISVSTSSGARIVSSRDGYYAPKPTPIRPSIEFTIMDLQRRYLDITRDDLAVLEDGVPQAIDSFTEAVDPVSVVLLLDQSGSMKKSAEAVKSAAADFVRSLRPDDRLAVMVFSDKPVIAHAFSTNRQWSLQAIDQYKADGGTALYDAVGESLDWFKGMNGRRVIVLLTDGRDEDNPGTGPGSKRSYAAVLEALKQNDVTLFSIGLGTRIDPPLLTELATVSGGQSYFPADVSTLAEQYALIVENIRRRYILSYTSTNGQHDGSWRRLQIRTRQPDVIVTARNGYFAPAK